MSNPGENVNLEKPAEAKVNHKVLWASSDFSIVGCSLDMYFRKTTGTRAFKHRHSWTGQFSSRIYLRNMRE